MDILGFIPGPWQPWLAVVGAAYTLISVVAAVTPTKKDDKIVSWLDKVGSFADRFGFRLKTPK